MTLNIHIIMGILAAFIAFPVTILARKGSRRHIFAGRLFVISFVLVCLTGYVIDADDFLKIGLFNRLIGHTVLKSNIHILITLCINTFALYLCISGWRVAYQHHVGAISKKNAIFDGCLAIIEIIMVLIFILCFIDEFYFIRKWSFSLSLKYDILLLLIACIPFIDAGQDFYYALKRTSAPDWWKIHFRKMLMAQYGLIIAFVLRCLSLKHYVLILLISVFFIVLYLWQTTIVGDLLKKNR